MWYCYCLAMLLLETASCARHDITWTVQGVAAYNRLVTPLLVDDGDTIAFRCVNASFSNIIFQTSAEQFTHCNSSLGTKSLVFADCRGTEREVTDNIEEASGSEITNIISYKQGETYYFTSYSNGFSAMSATADITSGGECLEGLRMVLEVRDAPTTMPPPPPSSASTSPTTPTTPTTTATVATTTSDIGLGVTGGLGDNAAASHILTLWTLLVCVAMAIVVRQ